MSVGKSRRNLVEASAIGRWLAGTKSHIEELYKDQKKSFDELTAVITPFTAQAREIRAALHKNLGPNKITVGTVDALQGAERRIVIFSPTYGLNAEPGHTRFDTHRSILNVAVSRAQDAFLVFGNMRLFHPRGNHPAAILGKLMYQMTDNELANVPVDALVPGFDSLGQGALIRDIQGHRAVLDEALTTARHHLVIVSPFLTKTAIESEDIPSKINAAVRRGVNITVVTDSVFANDKDHFAECVKVMQDSGANVRIASSQGVHSKLLLVDGHWLVVGSFNWLSARRTPGIHQRYESSMRYDGTDSYQMIKSTLRDLSSLISG